MVAAATAVDADRAVLCVKSGPDTLPSALGLAVSQRPSEGVTLEVVAVPGRYVTGEETALVNWLNTRRALPTSNAPRSAAHGVDRRPTLVDNVETLACVALIARFGARWWRQVGTEDEPGSVLLSVSGGVQHPGVREIALGTPLRDVLQQAQALPAAGVLVGGYFGAWLTADQADRVALSDASLAGVGAGLGCGALAVMPHGQCPLREVARVGRWLAQQSAGQCGPCVNGLPAIAAALEELGSGRDVTAAELAARRWGDMVVGRGGCKLPDGAVMFARSALDVFSEHTELHRLRGACPGSDAEPVLPTPGLDGD